MLNPELYRRLVERYQPVKIVREDVEMRYKYVTRIGHDNQITKKLERVVSGEEYHIRCPRCNDHSPRLSISYLWGKFDPVSNSRNLWLMQCWNDATCFSSYSNRREFFEDLYPRGEISGDISGPSEPRSLTIHGGRVRMPGALWRVDKMATKMPNHAAVQYLYNRLLNPFELGEQFGVGYCPEPEDRAAENRLIFPVYFKEKLKGWSGRYIGEPTDKTVRKWYHMPDMQKSELFYNFDRAKNCHTKVIVEGPGDTAGVGRCGMGVLGKTVSPQQINLLQECCIGDDFAIVLMLDPKQSEKEREDGREHHMEKAYRELREIPRFRKRVFKTYISHSVDPGEADRGYLHDMIRHVAAREKIKVILEE